MYSKGCARIGYFRFTLIDNVDVFSNQCPQGSKESSKSFEIFKRQNTIVQIFWCNLR